MGRSVTVLLVEQDPGVRSAVRAVLSSAGDLELIGEALTPHEALVIAESDAPDLILLDIDETGLDGRATMQLFSARAPGSRVIAWTTQGGAEHVTEMIAAGAFGYLLKGIPPKELMDSLVWASRGQSVLARDLTSTVMTEISRLYRHAEQRAEELRTSYLSTVMSLATALETKDDQTGNHARRVRDYATIITSTFDRGLSSSDNLQFGFLLHDVGKIGIPDRILLKPGPLTDDEWEIMRKHTLLGAHILRTATFLDGHALEVVTSHHERWDGKGYPHRLAADEIPIGARVFAVADTFDAMTSDRPYRKGLPADVALVEIQKNAGSQFDPDVVAAFRDCKDALMERMQTEVDLTEAEPWWRLPQMTILGPEDLEPDTAETGSEDGKSPAGG